MALFNCCCKNNCTAAAVVVSAILGVLAAFLQITGVITVATAFLWVVFGVAAVYLAVLLFGAVFSRHHGQRCTCSALNTLLSGVLGSILFALVLLAVGIVATSVVNAILVGLLVGFFALTVTGSACYVRCLTDCES